MDICDILICSQQSDRTVAFLGKDTVDLNVADRPKGTLMCIERHQIIVARTLQIADSTEMTVAVKMQTVHIDAARIAAVIVKHDIAAGKIGNGVEVDAEVGRIFDGQIRNM